ncbi:MAG: hypothetical protein K2L93_00340 [Muribaculaceae bacterium]|nr:hypothetical protein [Muribaculaceae bacterium]MDE6320725.1 hypothetical protein [Muribaculaceae bacterium]
MNTLKHLLALSMTILLIAGCSSKKDESSDSSSSSNSEGAACVTEVNNELLRTVDYNATAVLVANLESVFSTYSVDNAVIKDYDEFADLSSVVLVMPSLNGESYTTFLIDNADAFNTYANGNLTQLTDRGDFAVYANRYDDRYVMVKGSQMWVGRSPSSIEQSVKNAATRHFGQGLAISTSIEQPHSVNIAVNMSAIPNIKEYGSEFADAWGIANVDMTKSTITGDAKIISSNGDAVMVPGMRELSTKFLNYTMGEPNVALAMGIGKDFPWKTVQKVLTEAGADPSDLSLLPILGKMIDGTVSASVSIDSNSGEIYFSALIESSNADPEAVIGMLQGFVGQVSSTSDGFYSIPVDALPSGNIYLGAVGEAFFIGSHHPSQLSGNNNLQSVFSGNEAALSINVPKSLMMMLTEGEGTFGLNGKVQVEKSTAHFEVKVTDTDMSIIEAFNKM